MGSVSQAIGKAAKEAGVTIVTDAEVYYNFWNNQSVSFLSPLLNLSGSDLSFIQ